MTEKTEIEKPKLSKKEQRIAAAKQLIADWKDEDREEDIVSGLAYRAHIVNVLQALGFTDAHANLVAAVDRRIACGLEELDVTGLAFSGKLLTAIAESEIEIAEKTIANTEEAKLEATRRQQTGGPKNGPVARPSRRQSM